MLLKETIEKAKMNQSSMMEIVEKFKPLILKYASFMQHPDAAQDLILDLIVLIKGVDLSKINTSEGVLVSYIAKSLYHSYIRHAKRYQHERDSVELKLELRASAGQALAAEPDFWHRVKDALNTSEFEIVVLWAVYGLTDTEISKIRGISRQAISKMKKKAYGKLRRALDAYKN